ncbi:MAG: hypothetical protein OEY94_02425 [Alphaproteobacteria bacterium]|nr:hypothetical protein [Alphaproteobacteria bacterium]
MTLASEFDKPKPKPTDEEDKLWNYAACVSDVLDLDLREVLNALHTTQSNKFKEVGEKSEQNHNPEFWKIIIIYIFALISLGLFTAKLSGSDVGAPLAFTTLVTALCGYSLFSGNENYDELRNSVQEASWQFEESGKTLSPYFEDMIAESMKPEPSQPQF